MRGPTIALLIGIAVVVIAAAVALPFIVSKSGGGMQPTTQPIQTLTSPPTGAISISYDPELAAKGKQYFNEIGCIGCHSIRSLGIYGGNVGPDLSKALLGNPGQAGSQIGRYFKEKGLDNPAADPQKAAQLVAQYLNDPPDYAGTMKTMTNTYKSAYPDWATDKVPAFVELLKEAASK